ncbi:sugar phosphate isomerase/epimerase [Streptomyces thinghirensis]|nr:sugar phosphate isomerase/epimerase [Streptomyces thinghirensis]
MELLGLAGYSRVAAPGDDDAVIAEIRALLDLARDLGAPYVGSSPAAMPTRAPRRPTRRRPAGLGTAAGYATEVDVRILLETHDSHRTGADAMRVLGLVGHRQVGALWDVMHTWLGGEQPSETTSPSPRTSATSRSRTSPSAEDSHPAAARGPACCRSPRWWTSSPATAGTAGCAGSTRSGGTRSAAPLPELLVAGREHLARLLSDAA